MERRTVYIGKKPLVNYILAILNTEGRIIVSARGKLISKAVSAVLASKQRGEILNRKIEVRKIHIGSEFIGDPPSPVSFIRIELDVEKKSV